MAIKGDSWFGRVKKEYVIVTSIIVMLVLIVLMSLTAFLSITCGKCESNEMVKQEATDQTTEANLKQHFQIIPRRTWLAQSPTGELNKLHLPIPYVIIMHTDTDQCRNQADCMLAVRHIQTFHMESNKWSDIGYNFLIGGDGFAYEGRGWKFQGAHTRNNSLISIGIAFIGTYDTIPPKNAQMTACKKLIKQGVKNGEIHKHYKILDAKQVIYTKNPGIMLSKKIQKWPHWSPTP